MQFRWPISLKSAKPQAKSMPSNYGMFGLGGSPTSAPPAVCRDTLNLLSLNVGIVASMTSLLARNMASAKLRLYAEHSPLAVAIVNSGATTINPFKRCVIINPGDYRILIRNNTANLNVSVAATGAARLFF